MLQICLSIDPVGDGEKYSLSGDTADGVTGGELRVPGCGGGDRSDDSREGGTGTEKEGSCNRLSQAGTSGYPGGVIGESDTDKSNEGTGAHKDEKLRKKRPERVIHRRMESV